MSEFFSIKNLEKYQHYGDRKPVWVKLHCNILSDISFNLLSNKGKLAFLLLIPLASMHKNKLPNNSQLISKLLTLDYGVDLEELVKHGLVKGYEESKKLQTARVAVEVRKNEPKKSSLILSYISICNKVISFLNDKANKGFRETDGNREQIIARLKEGFTEEDCQRVIVNRLAHWKNTDMEQYLRPCTLFRKRKFEGYLNSPMPEQIKETTKGKFETSQKDIERGTLKSFVEGNGSCGNKSGLKTISGAQND